jgi:acetyltransferase-like isoleucine patch superfamily enzyme
VTGSEREKMLAGELYDPLDPELVAGRERARDLCRTLNRTREFQVDERRRILRELFGAGGDTVWMQPPFYCDYGSNIHLGARVFFNFNCVVLDVCDVRIGDYTLFGPGAQILTRSTPSIRRCAGSGSSESRWRSARTCGSAGARSSWRASGSARARSSARAAS